MSNIPLVLFQYCEIIVGNHCNQQLKRIAYVRIQTLDNKIVCSAGTLSHYTTVAHLILSKMEKATKVMCCQVKVSLGSCISLKNDILVKSLATNNKS
jgi:hypothetical protein